MIVLLYVLFTNDFIFFIGKLNSQKEDNEKVKYVIARFISIIQIFAANSGFSGNFL